MRKGKAICKVLKDIRKQLEIMGFKDFDIFEYIVK